MMSVFDFMAHFYDWGLSNKKTHFKEEFSREDVVLDLGGGTGRISRDLECTTIVCDISYSMLERARMKGMKCVRADASRLPFKKAFTKIIIVDALHHFKNREDALRDAAQVLKKGGVLLINDFDPSHSWTKVIALIERLALEKGSFVSPQDLQKVLEKHGFTSFSLERNEAEFLLKAVRG